MALFLLMTFKFTRKFLHLLTPRKVYEIKPSDATGVSLCNDGLIRPYNGLFYGNYLN
jgi:hypothetical protein